MINQLSLVALLEKLVETYTKVGFNAQPHWVSTLDDGLVIKDDTGQIVEIIDFLSES